MVQIGDVAPDFSLPATWDENFSPEQKKMISLSSYRGNKNVLLMFYPLDWSPVCSSEHKKCTSMFPTVSDKVQILGISVDSIWSHNAYAKAYGIRYPLLSDFQPRGAVAERYGVYLPDLGIAARTAFLVDRDGRVKLVVNAAIPDERRIEVLVQEAGRA
jgi:mycoredoxin-dependent peroxiredoxin